jgi:hypothetical protein
MPKIAVPSHHSVFKNHSSFDGDPAVRRALGPVIAKWLAQGVPKLECVCWDDRQAVLVQQCGAVPESTAPFYRPITDAHHGNKLYSDWESRISLLNSSALRCTDH